MRYPERVVAFPGTTLFAGPGEDVQQEISVDEESVRLAGRQRSRRRVQIERARHRRRRVDAAAADAAARRVVIGSDETHVDQFVEYRTRIGVGIDRLQTHYFRVQSGV